MLCFLDTTFCSYYKECKLQCKRALTPKIESRAKEHGMDIAQFTNAPYDYDGNSKVCDHQSK